LDTRDDMTKIELKADCSKYFTGQCDCGIPQCCMRIMFDIYDIDNPFVEICMMNYGGMTLGDRIRAIIYILRGKEYVFNGVILGKDEWNKLREFVLAKQL